MLELLDYRRQVTEMYRSVQRKGGDAAGWSAFKSQRDALFRTHPQSPLDLKQKSKFRGLPYYAYNVAFRVTVPMDTGVEPEVFEMDLGEDGLCKMQRVGRVQFKVPSGRGTLNVYWIMGYGGGLFLPFGDTTNGNTTYGGGRYLFDTIKGVDLGSKQGKIVLDFNYAYHPSCFYNEKWVCPLSPAENKLPFPIPSGEKM